MQALHAVFLVAAHQGAYPAGRDTEVCGGQCLGHARLGDRDDDGPVSCVAHVPGSRRTWVVVAEACLGARAERCGGTVPGCRTVERRHEARHRHLRSDDAWALLVDRVDVGVDGADHLNFKSMTCLIS